MATRLASFDHIAIGLPGDALRYDVTKAAMRAGLVPPGANGQPFFSPTVVLGHWEHAERKMQAAKMEGAFLV